MPKVQKSHRADIRKQLQMLDAQRSSLLQQLDSEPAGVPAMPPRMPLWMVIREYLRSPRADKRPAKIAEALTENHHDLGKYPLRNVKITVTSPHLSNIFRMDVDPKSKEEIVVLMDNDYHYIPTSLREANYTTKAAARAN